MHPCVITASCGHWYDCVLDPYCTVLAVDDNLMFGCISSVMNVKFWKTLVRLLVTDIPCHVATAHWHWSGFLLTSLLQCRECLNRQFTYLDFLYNPAPEGSNWPHSYYWSLLHIWRRLQACYVEELLCMCLRFIWYQFVLGKSCWIYFGFYTPFGNLHFELSTFG